METEAELSEETRSLALEITEFQPFLQVRSTNPAPYVISDNLDPTYTFTANNFAELDAEMCRLSRIPGDYVLTLNQDLIVDTSEFTCLGIFGNSDWLVNVMGTQFAEN